MRCFEEAWWTFLKLYVRTVVTLALASAFQLLISLVACSACGVTGSVAVITDLIIVCLGGLPGGWPINKNPSNPGVPQSCGLIA